MNSNTQQCVIIQIYAKAVHKILRTLQDAVASTPTFSSNSLK